MKWIEVGYNCKLVLQYTGIFDICRVAPQGTGITLHICFLSSPFLPGDLERRMIDVAGAQEGNICDTAVDQ